MRYPIDPDAYLDDAESEFSNHSHKTKGPKGQPGRVKFLAEIASHAGKIQTDYQTGFMPTFSPSEHERSWILDGLEQFYNNQIITDVLTKVKGGKEANVYCCSAHPSTGLDLLAAKIDRPRMFRNLRNDARYRQGREMLDENGKVSHSRRETLAMQKNTHFGKELRHISWLEAEYQTLQILYSAGADVPKPLTHGGNVILMEFVGEQALPAPTLQQVNLTQPQARATFNRLLENLSILLACHRVHADLSAYNILYEPDGFKIIDFPQAVDPRRNPDAGDLFFRDVERVCQYFNRYSLSLRAPEIANRLWEKYRFTNALDEGYKESAELDE
jgi:RIO kinase 1